MIAQNKKIYPSVTAILEEIWTNDSQLTLLSLFNLHSLLFVFVFL